MIPKIIHYCWFGGNPLPESTKKYIEDYAHNMGIAKSKEGHIVTSEPVLIGYAYGEDWGRWNAKFQYVNIYH